MRARNVGLPPYLGTTHLDSHMARMMRQSWKSSSSLKGSEFRGRHRLRIISHPISFGLIGSITIAVKVDL